MTASPHTVRPGISLAEAHREMRDRNIRHLPVLDGGKLVGVVSQRDLYLIETLKDVDPESVPVEDAMSQNTWTTSADAPLTEVLQHMVANKEGSAVVMQGTRLVGLFTTTDALKAFSDVLEKERKAK
jgi:acetoin utilization protein AcuB